MPVRDCPNVIVDRRCPAKMHAGREEEVAAIAMLLGSLGRFCSSSPCSEGCLLYTSDAADDM
eukprot:10367795-Alexandrium_andersonii.AAC.1